MYFKQISEIVNGTKTQTRRICKPNEEAFYDGFVQNIESVCTRYLQKPKSQDTPLEAYRLKWEVGRDYAVSPGRGKPGLLWCAQTDRIWTEAWGRENAWSIEHFIPLRIRLLEIRREPLQDISVEDAIAEGYPDDGVKHPIRWYGNLWNSINTRKGTRWDDNPAVWALTFEVVRA